MQSLSGPGDVTSVGGERWRRRCHGSMSPWKVDGKRTRMDAQGRKEKELALKASATSCAAPSWPHTRPTGTGESSGAP